MTTDFKAKNKLIPANLAALHQRIAGACARAGRPPEAVRLLAVGKGQAAAAIAAAAGAGQRDFAENYLQEALPKIAALAGRGLRWHFIGPLQSNKTADVAAHFDWVHGVDREKIARRLSDQRPASLPPMDVCVQVNISGEASKSGVAPGEAAALCRVVAGMPRLKLRGLMAIPAPAEKRGRSPFPEKGDSPRLAYRRLRELYESLRREFELDTLSAGMSDDFEAAIAEGSTMIRIGTALFGSRGQN
ncbi:MAG: YggS family pyridoxal phosphate-dependent enzyme [Gammaproteobacteria bacterium]